MKKIILPLFLLLFLIPACSRLDIAMQLADNYVANKADDYFDLTREQKSWLKDHFTKDFATVKKIIFPQLAAELKKVADIVESKKTLDAPLVSETFERVKNLFYEGMRIFTPNAVLFADKLTPQQMAYFQKEFNKKMNDLKEDESSKDSYKKMKKHFDSWMGSITSNQKKELEKFTNSNPPPTAEKIYVRQLLAQEFVKAYPDKGSRKKFVEKLFNQFDSSYEEKFSKAAKERNQKMVSVTATILNMMNDSQRAALVDALRDRANQLIKISKG